MLSSYQLKIADFYISIGTAKNFVPSIFDKEKCALHYENLQLYLRIDGLKLNKILRVLQLNQLRWLKPYVKFNT